MNTKDENAQDDNLKTEGKIETAKIAKFNTLIKGFGSPTIIFESGLGTPLNNWESLQPRNTANYTTTDHHGMHITGKYREKQGGTYYKMKNSWGLESNDCDGYL